MSWFKFEDLSSELASIYQDDMLELNCIPLHSLILKFRMVSSPEKYRIEFALYMRYGGFTGIHHMEFDDEVIAQYIQQFITLFC
jgi:hypothetical protein